MGDGHDLSSGKFSGNKDLESVFDNHAVLRRGSTGSAVTLVQEALMNLGYALPSFGADGDYGKETEAAVRAFQQDTGAAVDGVVGTETIGFLDRRVQGKPLAPPVAPVVTNTALDPKNIIVEPGASPIHAPALGANTYGYTDTETVGINISAVKSGNSWQAVVNGLTGNYSLRARLLPGQQEVDPGSNTSAANFFAQATELKNLGNPAATAAWYMESAVLAHERVHATRLRPALLSVAPTIEAQVEAIRIPDFLAADAASAAALLRLHPAFLLAMANARTVWDAQYVTLINGDHGGPTDAAEHQIVDPVVNRIRQMAKANRWGPCP
jgi:peptidoglycan hydrolase-like protein with peptidoglycan-binding domain